MLPDKAQESVLGMGMKVAVIVATCDRSELLAIRSIPSIMNQTRKPDLLIVVDDSTSPIHKKANYEYIESIKSNLPDVKFIDNQRTAGASGAWNTGIDLLFQQSEAPNETFLAILDDDDAWKPTYLEKCVSLTIRMNADAVAADISRIEELGAPPLEDPGPNSLNAQDFLVGNPGVQASNLFVRLTKILMAGCFDESLHSCTDRDLCIRLADLHDIRFVRLDEALVTHYAEPERLRLTSSGSPAKIAGLDAFWSKYAGRMTPQQRHSFCDRAESLFMWKRPTIDGVFFDPPRVERIAIVLGLRSSCPDLELIARHVDSKIVGLDVVLYQDEQDLEFDAKVTLLRNFGIGCFPLRAAIQASLNMESVEAIEHICTAIAATRIGAEAWIVDEQKATTTPVELLSKLGARSLEMSVIPIVDEYTKAQILSARIETARSRIFNRFRCSKLRLLGSGSEAIVFTDEMIVYKCIDYWKTRLPTNQLNFLKSKIGKWNQVDGLYELKSVSEDGSWAILTYDYEPSNTYLGGHEASILRLLESCRNAEIVCNNIHPKNLIVSDNGVKLIDYGSDIRPWTLLGFEQMTRRAFLSCYFHDHPSLSELMKKSLADDSFAEMKHYSDFRSKITPHPTVFRRAFSAPWKTSRQVKPTKVDFIVGLITSEPETAWPLLQSFHLQNLDFQFLILDNGCHPDELKSLLSKSQRFGLKVRVYGLNQQKNDAKKGVFGSKYKERGENVVGIAQARTMIQRYLGQEMKLRPNSIGWLLDDDMRIDDRAIEYLPWLEVLRENGVDVVLGSYEGSSPNPPINGLRVQLVDVAYNLQWLSGLRPEQLLPDRSDENSKSRSDFPDYYYDLSRKHTAHLEQPHWLEPVLPTETVREAKLRLIHQASRVLDGAPITRALRAKTPVDPLIEAHDSVNRGGTTFILNPATLSHTPNITVEVRGKEARRSDMLWAIINRYYRNFVIKKVEFPILHEARISTTKDFNFTKIQGEIVGSALYAGLTNFLSECPSHDLEFTDSELNQILMQCEDELRSRLIRLNTSFYRIQGLTKALKNIVENNELQYLINQLEFWFTEQNWDDLVRNVHSIKLEEVRTFVGSMRSLSDDFALASGILNQNL